MVPKSNFLENLHTSQFKDSKILYLKSIFGHIGPKTKT